MFLLTSFVLFFLLTWVYHPNQSTQRLGSPAAMEARVNIQTEDVVNVVRKLLLDQQLDELHSSSRDLLPTFQTGNWTHRQLKGGEEEERSGLSAVEPAPSLYTTASSAHLSAGSHFDWRYLLWPVGKHIYVHIKTNEEVLLCRLQEALQEHHVPVQNVTSGFRHTMFKAVSTPHRGHTNFPTANTVTATLMFWGL